MRISDWSSDVCSSDLNLFNGYGMTEASLTLVLHPRDALAKLGACGKPTLVSDARVVACDPARDVRPGETVPAGEVGQLIVQGPQMTPGYWNNTAESACKLDRKSTRLNSSH